MQLKVFDRKQNPLSFMDSVDGDTIKSTFMEYKRSGDYTIIVGDEEGIALYISIDRGLYTLFIQLGEDEFYDYVSTTENLGQVEFIQGGQLVTIDQKYLVNEDIVLSTIDKFMHNPLVIRKDTHWQQQV